VINFVFFPLWKSYKHWYIYSCIFFIYLVWRTLAQSYKSNFY